MSEQHLRIAMNELATTTTTHRVECVPCDDVSVPIGWWGPMIVIVNRDDIEHLLNGGVWSYSDGEYEHYFVLSQTP